MPEWDGQIHQERTDDWKGWYAGHKTEVGTHTVYSLILGDYRSGSQETLRDGDDKLTPSMLGKVRKNLEAQTQATEEQKLRLQKLARKEAQALYDSAVPVNNVEHLPSYMTRKKWGLYVTGIKLSPQFAEDILVPLYDINGELWSLQTTFMSGDKMFFPGGRTNETYFPFGKLTTATRTCYLAEGVATAMSVHAATGKPTLACMSANNLVSVARVVQKHFPLCSFIVCGDDDKRTPNNPGRLKAEEAARIIGSVACFPLFSDPDSKGTDWNDLHCEEGLQTVTDLLVGVTPPPPQYIQALGVFKGKYFYTSSSNPQISSFTDHSEDNLLKLMPHEYYLNTYGEEDAKGIRRLVWVTVKSALMERCRAVGIFDPSRIRGLGTFIDNGTIVTNLGDRLYYDGEEHSLNDFDSHYIYEYTTKLEPFHTDILSIHDIKPLHDIMSLLNFTEPEMAKYLLGWIALAPFCGALAWRPHLYLTGEAGSGKSTVLSHIIGPLLDGFRAISLQGSSTEAGLRQKIQSNALPVVFDEFEAENMHGNARIDKILELFRQSSSSNGSEIVKGSSFGEANTYSAQFMGVVSGIQPKLKAGADRSRFTFVELKKITGNADQWTQLQAALQFITEEFARRFVARGLSLLPTTLKNVEKIQSYASTIQSQRFGQQQGALLAGYFSTISDAEITDGEVVALCRSVHIQADASLLRPKTTVDENNDPIECLQKLLTTDIGMGKTISSLLFIYPDPTNEEGIEPEQDELALRGVVFCSHKENDGSVVRGISISSKHDALRKVFKDTRWDGNWCVALARLHGVVKSHKAKYKGIYQPRGVFIPLELVKSYYGES